MARSSALLLALSALGFASLGLPDSVLGVAWPSMRASFGLPLDALGALLVSATAGYVASSAASGRILARVSIGTLLAASCAVTAIALIGYAAVGSWAAIVALGAVAGLGAGAIDAGINLYAATHHSRRMLGLLHAGYGLGTTSGPAIMTSVLMAGSGWQSGYAILGGAQVALALCFAATRRQWPRPSPASSAAAAAPLARTLRLPAVQLGIAGFFVYVGLAAAAGAWIYSWLVGARDVSMVGAGAAVSVYWGGLLVGRLLLAVLPSPRDPSSVLRVCTGALALAAGALALDLGAAAAVASIALYGLAAGPIFPALMAATPPRVGLAHAPNAVGISVAAAAVGQSLLPAGIGIAAGAFGLEAIPRLLTAGAVTLVALHHALERVTRAPAPVAEGAAASA